LENKDFQVVENCALIDKEMRSLNWDCNGWIIKEDS
jgi:hypothetical protein